MKIILAIGLLFLNTVTIAQHNGVYIASTASEKVQMPYQFVREADVMYSRVIWRRMSLIEKMNLPLYYPTEPMEGRKSLIQLIMWGIQNKSLNAFSTDEFSGQRTMAEIDERFGASTDTVFDVDDNTGEMIPIITKNEADYSQIKEFLVKEIWFFDKQRSVMEVRIIGICPIRVYYRDDDLDQADAKYKKIFWIYYPEARNIFANTPVFNQNNQADTKTFDDVFSKRMFTGFIYQESNVYDNRLINEYTTGLDVLLESERIKNEIFNFEHDMWEF